MERRKGLIMRKDNYMNKKQTKNKVKKKYKYTEDDAYLYADKNGDCELIGLVFVFVAVIGIVLYNILS